jgi:hypothetical protein
MKKVIKYNFLISETDDEKVFIEKTLPYSDEALEMAEKEAYEGEYTIEEIPEAPKEPTAEERIAELEAQNEMLMACVLEMSEKVYA